MSTSCASIPIKASGFAQDEGATIPGQQAVIQNGPIAVLLHGWPDAPRAWRLFAERLHTQGWRTVIPYFSWLGAKEFSALRNTACWRRRRARAEFRAFPFRLKR